MSSTLTPDELRKKKEIRQRAAGHWSDEQRGDFAKIWRKWEKGVEFLENTNLPVIELYGDRGREPASLDQLFVPDRPNISVVWIKNASHKLPLEEPEKVGNIIMEFIAKIENKR
jgi:hypothetical protein